MSYFDSEGLLWYGIIEEDFQIHRVQPKSAGEKTLQGRSTVHYGDSVLESFFCNAGCIP